MIALVKQVAEVERELDLLLASDETIRAIEEIEGAIDELDKCQKRVAVSMSERRALCESTEEFDFSDVLDVESALREKAVESFVLVTNAWEVDRAKIRQSGTVGQLAVTLKDYESAVANNTKNEWQAWTNSLAGAFSVSDAELESVKGIPDYVQPIKEYKRLREEFGVSVQQVPRNVAVVGGLASRAEQLQKIKDGLAFDLPKFVLDFFDALNDDGVFPLSKLTKELSDWLSQNNELKNLSIVRRGMRRF